MECAEVWFHQKCYQPWIFYSCSGAHIFPFKNRNKKSFPDQKVWTSLISKFVFDRALRNFTFKTGNICNTTKTNWIPWLWNNLLQSTELTLVQLYKCYALGFRPPCARVLFNPQLINPQCCNQELHTKDSTRTKCTTRLCGRQYG